MGMIEHCKAWVIAALLVAGLTAFPVMGIAEQDWCVRTSDTWGTMVRYAACPGIYKSGSDLYIIATFEASPTSLDYPYKVRAFRWYDSSHGNVEDIVEDVPNLSDLRDAFGSDLYYNNGERLAIYADGLGRIFSFEAERDPAHPWSWSYLTADTGFIVTQGKTLDLAVDLHGSEYLAQGILHMVWSSDGLQYAYRDSTGWHHDPIPGDPTGVILYPAIDVNSSGYPHIVFDGDSLNYAYKDETGWHLSALGGGEYYSIVVDSNGYAHVSFLNNGLWYYWQDADGWHTQLIPTSRTPDKCTAMALDNQERPYFVTCAQGSGVSTFDVMCVFEENGSWRESLLPISGADPDLYGCPVIEINSDGKPTIIAITSDQSMAVSTLDESPPTPDPLTWDAEPHESGDARVSMTCSTATDPSGVQYYFQEITGNTGGDDSSWQASATYTDTDLQYGTEYCYQVKATDCAGHETGWSDAACITLQDAHPPTPDPMTWASAPHRTSSTSIVMTATTASDTNGVEYYFEETTGNPGGDDSGWQDSPTYTDEGLAADTQYTYRAKARDKSPSQNETGSSSAVSVSTADPPSPNPMTWASPPQVTAPDQITMTATTATDPSGVEYYFQVQSAHPGGDDSGWQDSPTYTDTGLIDNAEYWYRVKARDKSSQHNETGWSDIRTTVTQSATTPDPVPDYGPLISTFFVDPNYSNASWTGWVLKDLVLDQSGNLYAIGEYTWDAGPDAPWQGLAVVAKWNAAGTLEWSHTYGDQWNHPETGAVDSHGNLFVAGRRWPDGVDGYDWFIMQIAPDGTLLLERDSPLGGNSIGWYSMAMDVDDNPILTSSYGTVYTYTAKMNWETGEFIWAHAFPWSSGTLHEHIVPNALDPVNRRVYIGKDWPDGSSQETIILIRNADDGNDIGYWEGDFCLGEEQPVALAVDDTGAVIGVTWHIGENIFSLYRILSDGTIQWDRQFYFSGFPYVLPRDVSVNTEGLIYVAGRVSDQAGWDAWSDKSHIFTICVDSDGHLRWRHVYDAGGPEEDDWVQGGSVACRADGTVFSGGSMSCTDTDWAWTFGIVPYGKTVSNSNGPAVFRVESTNGDVYADGPFYGSAFNSGSADVAEWVPVSEPVEPGDVLELDPDNPGHYRKCRTAYSDLVAGVVSTKPGFVLGSSSTPDIGPLTGDSVLLALAGIVPVKVTSEGGAIQPGDLLVSSSFPGYAMKWNPGSDASCSFIGKALESMNDKAGVISIILTGH